MPFLLLGQAKSLVLRHQLLNKNKKDAVWRHVTEYDAAESFHVLHMGPMSDDAVSNQLLSSNLCLLAMPLFGPGQAKSLVLCNHFWNQLLLPGAPAHQLEIYGSL
jgi:hypothetical protein